MKYVRILTYLRGRPSTQEEAAAGLCLTAESLKRAVTYLNREGHIEAAGVVPRLTGRGPSPRRWGVTPAACALLDQETRKKEEAERAAHLEDEDDDSAPLNPKTPDILKAIAAQPAVFHVWAQPRKAA